MALRTTRSPPVGSIRTPALWTNQGGSQWPQAQRCLYSPDPASTPLLVADAGQRRQVVRLNLSQVPNSPDSSITYSSYHASYWWLVLEGPPRHDGDASVCRLLVYCSSSLCIDHLSQVVDVAFREHLCPRLLYFWRYSLLLGRLGRDCHWQRPSLCSGSQCPCQPIQYLAYTHLPLYVTSFWPTLLNCLPRHCTFTRLSGYTRPFSVW